MRRVFRVGVASALRERSVETQIMSNFKQEETQCTYC